MDCTVNPGQHGHELPIEQDQQFLRAMAVDQDRKNLKRNALGHNALVGWGVSAWSSGGHPKRSCLCTVSDGSHFGSVAASTFSRIRITDRGESGSNVQFRPDALGLCPMNLAYEPHPLIRRLESITDLSQSEKDALLHLPLMLREFAADQVIVREGDHPSESCLVISGMAFRFKMTEDGKRQIMSFHIAGEIPDLQSLHLRTMDHGLSTLTPCKLAFISHRSLRSLFQQHPRLSEVFWRETLIDAAIFREWVVNVGRRPAPARMAHLLCELFLRHKAVGLVTDHAFEFPITQSEMADALGLSNVHVNRTLQELRARGLIGEQGHLLKILDWEGLKQAGEFDPTYLHQEPGDEAA
ncbi:Crp/Fnr family transcriptional regulator [Microvirga sp. Mcv34]|uniref:Crp/Fnr family transcriptional regulator n=1 Tax=Microvirga sp. Mcv34 TaxID=2926016 RepID=UPI002905BADF|nr:Crp/Fnr family transcriptional regulator [Microvirga sp. Mcv34]